MMLKFDGITGKLLAAPTAYMDEAPASWIQYVCASHQYSITRLERILGVRPKFHDWDLRVNRLDWLNVLKRANCNPDSFQKAFSSTEYSSHASKGRSSHLFRDGPPRYRWCSTCLQEDKRPYLRWWWRFPSSTHCPKHQIRLTSKCNSCRGELILSYALMVNAGRNNPISDLSHCQGCGFPRWLKVGNEPFDPEDLTGTPSISLDDESKGNSALLQELKNKLNAATKVSWGQDKFLVDEMSLIIGAEGAKQRPVLSINAKVFHAEYVPNVATTPEKWSSRIARWRLPVRHKMAYALRLIRSEKKLANGAPRKPDDTGCEST